MGLRIPLHGETKNDAVLKHRQQMVNMARVIDFEQGIVAGFRPQYMEYQLVRFGHVEPSFLLKPLSARQKTKQKARARLKELMRRGR